MKYVINSVARSSYICLYTKHFIIVIKAAIISVYSVLLSLVQWICIYQLNTNASVASTLTKKQVEDTGTPVEQPY
jgi:hypothetical protein